MYSPKFNQVADRALLIEAMQAYSFAILFGPQSTPGDHGCRSWPRTFRWWSKTRASTASSKATSPRPIATGKSLAGRETLVVFPGPHSYVSPTLYVEPLSVPTWNYIAVHAYGTLALVEDEAGQRSAAQRPDPDPRAGLCGKWRAMPDGFRRTMLAGIVGFRIPIARIEGKFKISQNRAPEERRNVQAAHAAGTPDQQALAAWMERLGG